MFYIKKILKDVFWAICFAVIVVLETSSSIFAFRLIAIISSAVLGAIICSMSDALNTHEQGIKMWIQSQTLMRKKEIYLSFSYLYRISVNGKYLMVKGNRLKKFQPVGGVYKYYNEAKRMLESMGCTPNIEMNNGEEPDDFRLNIKGKNLLKFGEWFQKMEDREYDPIREFYEELIVPGILCASDFKTLKYRKVGVHNVGITYSEPLQKYEWIYADIFDLILDDSQKSALLQAVENHPDEICLVTENEIKKQRCKNSLECNLSNNAKWILGE